MKLASRRRWLFSIALVAFVFTIALWFAFGRSRSSAALQRNDDPSTSAAAFALPPDAPTPTAFESAPSTPEVLSEMSRVETPRRPLSSDVGPDASEEVAADTTDSSDFGRFVGTLWGPGNQLVPDATLHASLVTGNAHHAARADPLDGTFRTRRVPAGVYTIEVSAPNFSRQFVGEFELLRRGELDLGVLQFHEGVRIDIRLSTFQTFPPRPCIELSLTGPESEPFAPIPLCDVRTWTNPMKPGLYQLQIDDFRFARFRAEIELRPEQDSIVDVTLRAATSRNFRLEWIEGTERPSRIDWSVRNLANTVVWSGFAIPQGEEPVELQVGSLEADVYHMRLATPDGRTARRMFSVLDLEPVEFVISLVVN